MVDLPNHQRQYMGKLEEIVDTLERRPAPPPLVVRKPYDEALRRRLMNITLPELFGEREVHSKEAARALFASLFLWNDCLPEAHELSQTVNSSVGSYCHAIVHRREPDLSNSQYWFRRIGPHPVLDHLYVAAVEILEKCDTDWCAAATADLEQRGKWEPALFIDWCQMALESQDPALLNILESIQLEEIRLLIEFCYRDAIR